MTSWNSEFVHPCFGILLVLYRENVGRGLVVNINKFLLGTVRYLPEQSVLPCNLATVGPLTRGHVMDVT